MDWMRKANRIHREPEWNIFCDPAGAKALLTSGVPVFMMPLDSTQVPLDPGKREAIFAHGSPLTDQLTLLYHQWMAKHAEPQRDTDVVRSGCCDIHLPAGSVPGKADVDGR